MVDEKRWLCSSRHAGYARLEALSQIGGVQKMILRRRVPDAVKWAALWATAPLGAAAGAAALLAGKRKAAALPRQGEGLAIAAIARNESESILEWVAFHRLMGVRNIILYDNDSDDGMKALLQPAIDEGFVLYHEIHGKKQQHNAYNDALARYGARYAFMAFIDCDEYLMPEERGASIPQILEEIAAKDPCIGGVAVNWCMYGSSGYKTAPDGLMTEKFVHRAPTQTGRGNDCVKTIVIPSRVRRFRHSHFPEYVFGFYGADCSGYPVKDAFNPIKAYAGLRINHYFTKSLAQWIKRRALGKADDDGVRSLEEFEQHDNNEVYDPSAAQYAEALKKAMKELSARRALPLKETP